MTPKQKSAHKRNYAIMRLCASTATVKSIMYELSRESMRAAIVNSHLKKAMRSLDNAIQSIRISDHSELYK